MLYTELLSALVCHVLTSSCPLHLRSVWALITFLSPASPGALPQWSSLWKALSFMSLSLNSGMIVTKLSGYANDTCRTTTSHGFQDCIQKLI